MNNGAEAGQEVFHAHLHVVPRLTGDHSFQKPQHVNVVTEAYQETKERLKSALAE